MPDLLDQKKLVENIKQEKEQPLYPNTELWSEATNQPPITQIPSYTPILHWNMVVGKNGYQSVYATGFTVC